MNTAVNPDCDPIPKTTTNTTAAVTFMGQAMAVYPLTLKFEEVVYKVKANSKRGSDDKTILTGVTGVVCPGEMLGMLGPSGSGKTTLLSALGGRLGRCGGSQHLSGKITYNGHHFSGPVRRKTGFVAQDDVLYPHLTVRETLTFTALLRLPSTLSRPERAYHAERVIAELGLGRVADSVVGGPLLRGISGGERKRLSIGLEMLVNPSLLLLDEPTSGLDSTTAQRILTTLKGLAAEGRTVVTTIHQPSTRLYHMFDKVVLLSEGRPIYYGRASAAVDYFSSIGFSSSSAAAAAAAANPADLMLDLASGIAPADDDSRKGVDQDDDDTSEKQKPRVREVLLASYDKKIATALKADGNEYNNHYHQWSSVNDVEAMVSCTTDRRRRLRRTAAVRKELQWSTSWWEQFTVLLSRSLKERRHEAFHRLRIFQVLSVAILGGLLWWQTPPSHIQDRVDRSALLLLRVLGLLPALQCRLHLPTGEAHAHQGEVLRHVPPLLLLPRPDRWRPPHGARTPHRVRRHHLLDGWPQARPGCLLPIPPRRPLHCSRLPEPRPRLRGCSHGGQAGHHPRLRHHPRLPHRRGLLRAAHPTLHSVAQVPQLQLLLLQAPRRHPLPRERRLRVLPGGHLQGSRLLFHKVCRVEQHVGRRLHHGHHAHHLPACGVQGTAEGGSQVGKDVSSSAIHLPTLYKPPPLHSINVCVKCEYRNEPSRQEFCCP